MKKGAEVILKWHHLPHIKKWKRINLKCVLLGIKLGNNCITELHLNLMNMVQYISYKIKTYNS